ncbi:MAG: SDR family NAD(P)-dependent oxidoreductase [Saprospiraceae bacterium]
MNFQDKNVLITGGSRGIGKATAIAFAEAGARVAINFRTNKNAAMETVSLLSGNGHFAIKADIGHPPSVEKLLDKVVEIMGSIDIVVNNAGIHEEHPADGVDYETWQREWLKTLQVNLVGPANVSYCAAQHMIRQGGGRIVNVSSRGAFRGEPTQPAYGASKAGLNSMSQSLAQGLAKHNIFVGVVAPCFVETDLTRSILESERGAGIKNQSPLKRVARPEEVAKGILFLAAEGTEFMTGAILDINGASYLRS